MATKEIGYVYILTNPSFREDWVKIGMTQNMEERLKSLDTTALPFEKFATLQTAKYQIAEKHVHHFIEMFTNLRIRDKREFFNVKAEQALKIFCEVAELLDDAIVTRYDKGKPDIIYPSTQVHPTVPEAEDDIDDVIADFRKFAATSVGDSTVRNYVAYLKGIVSQFLTKVVASKKDSVFQICSSQELIACIEALKANKDFAAANKNSRYFPSASLKKYLDFLESKEGSQKTESPKIPKEGKTSDSKTQAKRPPLNFYEMGIQYGEKLIWKDDPTLAAVVVSDRKVQFNGTEVSISALSAQLKGYKVKHIQPTPHWIYNGRPLSEIYDETYND